MHSPDSSILPIIMPTASRLVGACNCLYKLYWVCNAKAYGNIVSLFKHGVFVSLKRKKREKLHCINEVKRCIQRYVCMRRTRGINH